MARRYERICIIKPSSLGDVIHSLPVLAALRQACPEAYIGWVVAPASASLLVGHPQIDEVLLFDRRGWGRLRRGCPFLWYPSVLRSEPGPAADHHSRSLGDPCHTTCIL